MLATDSSSATAAEGAKDDQGRPTREEVRGPTEGNHKSTVRGFFGQEESEEAVLYGRYCLPVCGSGTGR